MEVMKNCSVEESVEMFVGLLVGELLTFWKNFEVLCGEF
jgi:hypothetical protein